MQYERVKPNVIYCTLDDDEAEDNIEGCFFALPKFGHNDIVCNRRDAIYSIHEVLTAPVEDSEFEQDKRKYIFFPNHKGSRCRINLPTWCYRFIDYRPKPYEYLDTGDYHYKDVESYRLSTMTPEKLYSSYRHGGGWIHCALVWVPGVDLRRQLLFSAKAAARQDKTKTFREHLAGYVDDACEYDMQWLKCYQSGEYIPDAEFISGTSVSLKEYNED